MRSSAERNIAVGVAGSATVTGCDLRGTVHVPEGAKLLLKDSVVHNCRWAGVDVDCTAVIQGCTIQDSQMGGIQVRAKGEATVTGATVTGKVTLGEGCRITVNTQSGIIAYKWRRLP